MEERPGRSLNLFQKVPMISAETETSQNTAGWCVCSFSVLCPPLPRDVLFKEAPPLPPGFV